MTAPHPRARRPAAEWPAGAPRPSAPPPPADGAPLRVALTVGSLAPEHGGPSRSVPALRDALAAHGVAADVVTPHGGRAASAGGGNLRGESFGNALRRHLVARRVELLHDNGVWLPSNHAAVSAARALGLPIVVSPRGMLEPWSLRHRAWKKRLAWWGYQRRDLRSAALLHATSQMEADHLRALGLRQPIAVVPNGVDVLARSPRGAPRGDRVALFLSRVHPKKGLPNLVTAWADVRPPGWRVVIAGPDEGGHAAEVMAAVRAAGLEQRFSFVGPVEGREKNALLQQADLFVFPTHSENFGIVVAEALAHGVPVITTTGTPWAEVRTERCGWWVDVGAEPLAAALREAVALSDAERAAMGERGRTWVRSRFAWPGIAEEMRAVYTWVLRGGPPPASVQRA